jgi:hypothetical protein
MDSLRDNRNSGPSCGASEREEEANEEEAWDAEGE